MDLFENSLRGARLSERRPKFSDGQSFLPQLLDLVH